MAIIEPEFLELTATLDIAAVWAENEQETASWVVLDRNLAEGWWGLSKFLLHMKAYAEARQAAVRAIERDAYLTNDVETLWHELGHGLSAVFTDPSLPVVHRELATTFNLSEVYAFTLQRMALSLPVLTAVMGLPEATAAGIVYYRNLKDLSVFRRYAAKFISEYEMFSGGDLTDGRPYADTMARFTGFYHQPESHLFDLVPEFYCADYLLGWLGEAVLAERLNGRFGDDACLAPEVGEWLKSLWRQGNAADLDAFFTQNRLGALDAGPLMRRWQRLWPSTTSARLQDHFPHAPVQSPR